MDAEQTAEAEAYYDTERISVVCYVDVRYAKGSAEGRADAIRAIKPRLDVGGVGPNGCYLAKMVTHKVISAR